MQLPFRTEATFGPLSMMDDIRAGVVNCVIVKDLSRFGREYINAGKYIDRLFPYYGVRLIAINDGVDTITRSSADDFNIMVKNLMNDNYCRDISIKIRSQLQVKRKNGEFIGAFAPYGYEKSPEDKNKLIVDVYAAEVVRDIFGWKLSGINQDAIARRLNEQSILSPLEYKRSKGMPYAAKADELRIFLAELEKECQKYNPSFAASGSWAELIEQYKDADTLTAEMVDAFIDEMILYNNGHVEVKFNFRNELDEVIHLAAIRQREVERYAM